MQLADKGIEFGFLREGWAIKFEYGRIEPLADFVGLHKSVMKLVNTDGYLYPPTGGEQTSSDGNKWRTIPKTKRPAHVYRLPASHILYLDLPKSENDVRHGSAGFILQLLAFLLRTRLQFADWSTDGRIPIEKVRGGGGLNVRNAVQAGSYLSKGHACWLNWPASVQRRFTVILYMFCRAPSHESDWEEFIIEYMILDALWKCAADLFRLKSSRHAERVTKLCAHFAITLEPGVLSIKKMVELRNDLFHESIWFGGQPGFGHHAVYFPYHMPMRMWMLNRELIGRFLELS